jgi:hypothetical protein
VHCYKHYLSSAHQPIRLDNGYTYNRNISQEVLGQCEGRVCSICNIQYFLHETDLGTFDTTGTCTHIFWYVCLSELKTHHPHDLQCPNCRVVADLIIHHERQPKIDTTSPKTVEIITDEPTAWCDWAMDTKIRALVTNIKNGVYDVHFIETWKIANMKDAKRRCTDPVKRIGNNVIVTHGHMKFSFSVNSTMSIV